MGAISKIRQLSPYFLAVIAVLFIAFMVIQDSSCTTITQAQRSPDKVAIAEINGETISLADYERRVQQALELTRAQQPGQDVDDSELRQQVFDAMVDEILRKQAAEQMGLSVTKKELLDNMLLNPPKEWADQFRDSNGVFMRQMYEDYVTNPNKIVEVFTAQGMPLEQAEKTKEQFVSQLFQLEDYMRVTKLQEALNAAVGASASIPSTLQAKLDYKINNSFADVRFIAVPADLASDEQAKPSDEELKAYYEKNKQYYEQKPSRKLKYVMYKQAPSGKDSARAQRRSAKFGETLAAAATISEKDSIFTMEMSTAGGESFDWKDAELIDPNLMMVLASLQKGDVFGPLTLADGFYYVRLDDQRLYEEQNVRASHILISFGSDKAAAEQQARDLMARAKGGEDFGALAQAHSTDPGSASKGGDLDYFGPGRMVKPFEDAAFGAKVGEIVGPVETQFGYHIIKVTDKKSLGSKQQFKYSQIVYRPIMSTATKQQIIASAAKLAEEVENGTPLDSLAAQQGLTVNESAFFVKSLAILGSQEVTNWAFENSKGDVLRKDVKNYGLIVAQIADTREAGIQPFEDVKDRLTRELTQRKKLDVVKGMADRIAQHCKSNGSLESYRQVDSTMQVMSAIEMRDNGTFQNFGAEYVATHAAFTMPLNTISDPIRGTRAWFIMVVDNRKEADMKGFEGAKLDLMRTSASQRRGNAYYTWFRNYRENSEIEDLRGKRN